MKLISALICFQLIFVSPSMAGMMSTQEYVRENQTSFGPMKYSRADIVAQLEKVGISKSEAKMRVSSLTDQELREVNRRVENMEAGAGPVGAILGVALGVFLILLITDIAGLTDVFPFTRKGSLTKD